MRHDPIPPSATGTECAHELSQRACIAEIEIESPADLLKNLSTICPGPYPNRRPGRCPAFVRGTHPDTSAQCWSGRPTEQRASTV
eukprot:4469957-Prymnesium_polylepis.1